MAFSRTQQMQATIAINTAGTNTVDFSFPRAARIKRYFSVPSVAQAAHATIVVTATFTNKGTDGLGTTELAVLTNDSDLADTITRESGAWVADDEKAIDTEARPGSPMNAQNVADAIAAGSVVQVALLGAGVTPIAGFHTVGIEYVEST